LGQSLNAPRGTIVAATGAAAKMPVGGPAPNSWGFFGSNQEFIAHWNEFASVADFTEENGQSPMVGIVNTISGGPFAATYIASAALAGRGVDILRTVGPGTNIQAAIYRLCTQARADGYSPRVMFYSAHGEADGAASMSEANYYAKATAWYSQCQTWAAQSMRDPAYVAPVYLTYPAIGTLAATTHQGIDEAIRRIGQDLPGAVDLGPIYQWPCESDRTHPTPTSYIQRGEAVGRAMKAQGAADVAVYMTGVVLTGSAAVVTFNVPVEKDTTLNVGQNLNTSLAEDGFEWFDNGSAIGITAVSYSGDEATLTLASTPSGTLAQQICRIANQTITASLTVGATNLPGSVVRATGTGWASLVEPSYTNHRWAIPQTFDEVA
jgi:hypothetical protein